MFKLILKRKCLYLKIVKMIKVEFFFIIINNRETFRGQSP